MGETRVVDVLGSRLVSRASDRDAIEAELRALKDNAVAMSTIAMSTFMYAIALHAAEPEAEPEVRRERFNDRREGTR